MNKVLIITYYWPPSGGAGVQRWLKFSKYLPEFGWEPFILTVDPEYAAYPATDKTRGNDVPDKLKVFRTPSLNYFSIYNKDKSKIPTAGFANNTGNRLKDKVLRFFRGNFFIPDPRRGWNSFAYKKACSIIESEEIGTVITTSPPHSTQLIGLKIKKRFPELTWIADLRDPWTDIYYYEQFYPTILAKKIDAGYEKSVLKNCDRIITVGPSLKKTFSEKLAGLTDKIDIITNGYDEDDFRGIERNLPSVFTITYVGTISDKYPIKGLLQALALLKEAGSKAVLRFVGTVPENILNESRLTLSHDAVEHIPYTSHEEAIKYMLDSSILLLIIPDHYDNRVIITGKLFEYMATGNKVLCLGPVDGDASSILKENDCGTCFSYLDISSIKDFIHSEMVNQKKTGAITKQFSHRNITEKLILTLGKSGKQ